MEFEPLLESIGKLLNIPLQADSHLSCKIDFPKEKIQVQLEMEQGTQNLIFGGNIVKIPPGRFKQNVFEQALKANNLDNPKGGILAYCPKTDQLVLFLKIPTQNITPEQIVAHLNLYKEKFIRWKEALERNEIPQLVGQVTAKGPSGLLGLK